MPGQLVVTATTPPPPPPAAVSSRGQLSLSDSQGPVNILVTSPPREPRLKSGGWFSRAFSTTSGVLIAVLLFIAVPPLVVCGGCFVVGSSAIATASRESRELTARAKKFALPKLREYGIQRIDRDCRAVDFLGETVLAGKGSDSSGGIHDFSVTWKVANFDGEKTWQMQRITIDSEVVWDKDGSPNRFRGR